MYKPFEIGGDAVLTSQNSHPGSQKSIPEGENSPPQTAYYRKCVTCADYGRTCNGPKLAALRSIRLVRDFHREIRDVREIPMKTIYANTNVGKSTVDDYFSHSEKDFKWTTVADIDNALTIICGGRVGQQLLDAPCPVSSTELQQERERAAAMVAAANNERDLAQAECQRLREKILAERDARSGAVEDARAEGQTKTDYLRDLAEKRYNLILSRDAEIKKLSIVIALLVIALLISSIGFAAYLAWDKLHPGVGLFW